MSLIEVKEGDQPLAFGLWLAEQVTHYGEYKVVPVCGLYFNSPAMVEVCKELDRRFLAMALQPLSKLEKFSIEVLTGLPVQTAAQRLLRRTTGI